MRAVYATSVTAEPRGTCTDQRAQAISPAMPWK